MCYRSPVGYRQMWVLQVRPKARMEHTLDFWTGCRVYDGKKCLGYGPTDVQAWNHAASAVYGEIEAFAFRQTQRLLRYGWTHEEIADKCMADFAAQTNEQTMCFIGMHDAAL